MNIEQIGIDCVSIIIDSNDFKFYNEIKEECKIYLWRHYEPHR